MIHTFGAEAVQCVAAGRIAARREICRDWWRRRQDGKRGGGVKSWLTAHQLNRKDRGYCHLDYA